MDRVRQRHEADPIFVWREDALRICEACALPETSAQPIASLIDDCVAIIGIERSEKGHVSNLDKQALRRQIDGLIKRLEKSQEVIEALLKPDVQLKWRFVETRLNNKGHPLFEEADAIQSSFDLLNTQIENTLLRLHPANELFNTAPTQRANSAADVRWVINACLEFWRAETKQAVTTSTSALDMNHDSSKAQIDALRPFPRLVYEICCFANLPVTPTSVDAQVKKVLSDELPS